MKLSIGTHKDITAILATNDMVAIGALEAITKLGLSVPEDISLIGADNDKITQLLKIPLTTIDYPKFKCGNVATKILINTLEGVNKRKKSKIILDCKLIIRGTCAPVQSE